MAYAASRHPRDLTDQQWDLIGPFLPELPAGKTVEGAPGGRTALCSMASSGS